VRVWNSGGGGLVGEGALRDLVRWWGVLRVAGAGGWGCFWRGWAWLGGWFWYELGFSSVIFVARLGGGGVGTSWRGLRVESLVV